MLRNYLIIALRILWNNKIFSIINITGLAIGMAAFLLIVKYVEFELSYENFHENKEQIYRLTYKRFNAGELSLNRAMSQNGIAPMIHKQIPEVENYCRIVRSLFTRNLITHVDHSGELVGFQTANLIYADSSYLSIFTLPFIEGNPEKALVASNSILLSEEYTDKIFGSEWHGTKSGDRHYPIGKIISVKNDVKNADCIVTGVYENPQRNAHLKPDAIISHHSLEQGSVYTRHWWDNTYNYFLLSKGTDAKTIERKIESVVPAQKKEWWKANNFYLEFNLQALKDIHLKSSLDGELEQNGDHRIVSVFIMVALIILIIAWINYLILSSVSSIYRRKEMGVRRVIGSSKYQVRLQLLMESLFINLIAASLAVTIAQICYPWFKELTGLPNSGSLFTYYLIDPKLLWGAIALIFVFGAVFSGLYPAILISKQDPSSTLKGNMAGRIYNGKMQITLAKNVITNGLVVFQFFIASLLIGASIVIYNQFNYMIGKDLGIDVDKVLIINGPGGFSRDSIFDTRKEVFRNRISDLHGIRNVAFSSYLPGSHIDFYSFRKQNEDPENNKLLSVGPIDHQTLSALDLKLVAGRGFDQKIKHISRDEFISGALRDKTIPIIINEKAVELFEFNSPEEAIDQVLVNGLGKSRIIGVVNNHNHYSPKSTYKPILYFDVLSSRDFCLIKLDKNPGEYSYDELRMQIEDIEKAWTTVFPDLPFDYHFLSDSYSTQFRGEEKLGEVFGIFTALSVIIAILGLFATTSFALERRTKEIGIRKVMGASNKQLLKLLTSNIFILLIISGFLALPLLYLGIEKWLEQYAFRIEISWWMFTVPISILVILSIITIGYYVMKAALANPVKALRYE